MKKMIYTAVAGLMVAGLASCNENAKLASQVEGIWSGNTTELVKKDKKKNADKGQNPVGAKINSMTPSFTFTKVDSVKNGGKVVYSGVYSVSQAVSSQAVDVPFEATASVKAVAEGTWTATGDDKIMLTINQSSVKTEIDPASVSFGYAVLTDKPVSELDSLKANLLPNLEVSFGAEVQKNVAMMKKLDDIKFPQAGTMTLEIGKTDYTLTKQ